ncbi:hypothetical protein NDU88_005653 [Pleurodeles waltl]|uniref:Uncharacterized protein n=1 Tax=Pleurodeles waltl TaxID=8319 RepID=A0AAV7SMH2_PLEWA|nr:hypothetical protein NDU88_005653 [Pleurodeles waltl]
MTAWTAARKSGPFGGALPVAYVEPRYVDENRPVTQAWSFSVSPFCTDRTDRRRRDVWLHIPDLLNPVGRKQQFSLDQTLVDLRRETSESPGHVYMTP